MLISYNYFEYLLEIQKMVVSLHHQIKQNKIMKNQNNQPALNESKMVYCLASNNGLLTKMPYGKYECSTGDGFDYEEDYLKSILKFDSKEAAQQYIEDNNYYALDIVIYQG